jgi:polar amino acid transport system substrate-binding protein
MRTGTLRCGYGIYPPLIVKDPNTGVLSGSMVDIMDEIVKQIGIKLEWTEEVDWGQIGETLQTNRIDAMCVPLWGTARRARAVLFSQPMFFSPVETFARGDDLRFDNNPAAINQPDIKISINDGDVSEEVALRDFPAAQRVAKVQLAGEGQLFMNIIDHKADVTFSHISFVDGFNKNNNNVIRKVPLPPVRVFSNVIGIKPGELQMKNMIAPTIPSWPGNEG